MGNKLAIALTVKPKKKKEEKRKVGLSARQSLIRWERKDNLIADWFEAMEMVMFNLTFFNPFLIIIIFWLKALNWGCLCLILSQCFFFLGLKLFDIRFEPSTIGTYIKHMYMALLWIEWCSCLCSWWIQAKLSTAFSALWLPQKELCMSSLSLSLSVFFVVAWNKVLELESEKWIVW